MSDYWNAYRARLLRNEAAIKDLAKAVVEINPDVEVYFHYEDRIQQSVYFFLGEETNHVGFHEVPYRWSGCGYTEFNKSHSGGENSSMPFDAQDVLTTFKPVTTVRKEHDRFFKSKEQFLNWHSWLRLADFCKQVK